MARITYKVHDIVIPQPNDPTKTISKTVYQSEEHHAENGMIGFDAPDRTIATGKVILIDSVSVIRGEGAAADTLDFIEFGAIPDINDKDLVWIIQGAEAITIAHNTSSPPSNSGPILLLSKANKKMIGTRMILLQRQGSNFQEIAFDGIVGNNGVLVEDDSGNAIIVCGSVASAVNHLKVTNAAAGNDIVIEPIGTDTNIGINITPKGAGRVTIPNATLSTTILGTPTSGTLTNCIGLPLTTGITGILPTGNGGTGLNSIGTSLQVLRVNAGATALEYATPAATGLTSLNADTTAAQIIAGTAGRISLVDAGATHTFDIDSAYVGQATITTLGTITTGVWNGTAITYANLSFSNNIVNGDISLTAAIATSKLADSANFVLINQANVFGDFIQTFKDNSITLESPDGLTPITIVNLQQTLARNLTIPILTANRNFVVTGETSQIALGTEVTGASTDLSDTANIARNSDNLSFFAATTSLQLLGVISDETGTGALVFGTSPVLVTPNIGTPSAGTINMANVTLNGTKAQFDTALSDGTFAYLNQANVFTANQTIQSGAESTLFFKDGSGNDIEIGRKSSGGFCNFIGKQTGFSGFNFETNESTVQTRQMSILNNGDTVLRALNKLYFDGVDGTGRLLAGDTFIQESSANVLDVFVGGTLFLKINQSIDSVRVVNASFVVDATEKLFLDGGSNTSIRESSADVIALEVGGVDRFSFSTTFDLNNSTAITWAGNANRRISNDTTGTVFEIESGDKFSWEINSVEEMFFDKTNGGGLNLKTNHLKFGVTGNGLGAEAYISAVAAGMRFNIPSGDNFQLTINGIPQYDIDTTRFDLKGHDLSDLGVVRLRRTDLTIAAGVITAALSYHQIAGEAAADDDLVTINGGATGNILYIKPSSNTVTITVKSTGNIVLSTAGDFVMDNINDMMCLLFDLTDWIEVSRSNNGV